MTPRPPGLAARILLFAAAIAAAGALGTAPRLRAAQAVRAGTPYTLLTASGRRPLATSDVRGHDMFGLDDLASLFQLQVHEDTLGALTVSYKGKTIILTPEQTLVSVNGRLVSLPAPPARAGRRWFVPVEFVGRALAPIYDTPLELRPESRLLIVGNLRVPHVSVTVAPAGPGARITIDIRPRTPETVTRSGTELRIAFQADDLDPVLPAVSSSGALVRSFSTSAPATLVIGLGPQAGQTRATTQAVGATAGRVEIDVMPAASPGQPQPSAPAPYPTPTPPAPSAPAAPATPAAPSGPLPGLPGAPAQPSLQTIVIDPGHGGSDPGVKGPHGTLEKDITMAVARQLKAAIESRLGVRVLLTRNGDQTLTADERASMANNNKADLFLSLHANASFRSNVQGAEVFYLGLDRDAAKATQEAQAGAQQLPVFGGGSRTLEIVPWQLAQARFIPESQAFAQMIEQQFQGKVPLDARGLTQAPLRVLVGANMPAVLVEMGYLTNPDQENQLGTAAYQNTIVQALYAAIVQFRDYLTHQTGRQNPGGPGTGAPKPASPQGAGR
ncbi:MAG: N-acetylmuramoyl-L-alanine amidase [Acidobacteriota bacterium]|nr:N-acetylmuramoyl-L-alanine amidase [Acidobacteriota bacterium]